MSGRGNSWQPFRRGTWWSPYEPYERDDPLNSRGQTPLDYVDPTWLTARNPGPLSPYDMGPGSERPTEYSRTRNEEQAPTAVYTCKHCGENFDTYQQLRYVLSTARSYAVD